MCSSSSMLAGLLRESSPQAATRCTASSVAIEPMCVESSRHQPRRRLRGEDDEMRIAAVCALLAMALTATAGCAQKDWIDRTVVTENVTGAWAGSMGAMDDLRFDLKQEGARVAGSFRTGGRSASLIGASSGALERSVAGYVFTLRDALGMFQLEETVSSEEMEGKMNATRQCTL